MQQYTINGKILKFKPHEFEGQKSIEYYETQIITALNKIGVTKDFIEINYNQEEPFAQVLWQINKKDFIFECESQKTTVQNLGAIAQAIQEDIRQITRGIKDLFTIMNQYQTTRTVTKKKNLLDYKTTNEETFSIQDIKSNTQVNESLDPRYRYLTKYSNDKLDIFYDKFKQECIKNNSLNHPLLKALKIIRQTRGLKL